ncbi:MAG: phosphatase PAP2 family protein [Chitinophagaceae bacterium]|nr:MAG: phosphatase PAP2 family protein [Chitinophagaceae bacterium]
MILLEAQLSLLQKLELWDKWLFVKINSQMTNPFLDNIMPYLRNSFYWAPLYLFLLLFAVLNFKGRGWWWVVLFLCTVSMTDIISSRVFKEVFERLRPCQDPDFYTYVRLLVNRCSAGYSFTSSHAANHFGMATFFFFTARHLIGKWAWLAFFWAAAISYAQIYVGVHYPFDVLGGALLGVVFGLFMGMFFNKRFGFATFGK